ncbi:MAG TPA: hypothetical protein VFQ36_17690 [Ktedonobacteraceae bacterium]|nr:hypothetical protein [Ktedonobacteraceae bacterium]
MTHPLKTDRTFLVEATLAVAFPYPIPVLPGNHSQILLFVAFTIDDT